MYVQSVGELRPRSESDGKNQKYSAAKNQRRPRTKPGGRRSAAVTRKHRADQKRHAGTRATGAVTRPQDRRHRDRGNYNGSASGSRETSSPLIGGSSGAARDARVTVPRRSARREQVPAETAEIGAGARVDLLGDQAEIVRKQIACSKTPRACIDLYSNRPSSSPRSITRTCWTSSVAFSELERREEPADLRPGRTMSRTGLPPCCLLC